MSSIVSRTVAALTVSGFAIVLTACGGSTPKAAAAKSTPGTVQGPAPTGAAPAAYTPWPEAEDSSTHGSTSMATGPQSAHLLWAAKLGSAVSEGASIGGGLGTIYESDNEGTLFAIDPKTGHTDWSFAGHGTIGVDLSTSVAVLPDGTVVWAGPNDTLYGFSSSGQKMWSLVLGGQPLSPVIAGPHSLYVMTRNGILSAVDVTANSAGQRWSIKLGSTSYGSPVIRPDGVVETTVDSCLIAVRDDGSKATKLWQFLAGKAIEVSPAVDAANLTVLGTNDGNEYGISPAGKEVWKDALGSFSYSSAAVSADGNAYFGSNAGVMTEADAATGKVIQTFSDSVDGKTSNIWTSAAVDAKGDVYFGTVSGHILGFNSTGQPLLDVATGATVDSYPTLTATGDLLIGSDNGKLYDIGAKA